MNTWLHNIPRLTGKRSNCILLMHPADASRLALEGERTVKVSSRTGEITVPLEISDAVMPGVVCLPFGWGHSRPGVRLSVAAAHPGASYNDLLSDLCYDAVSGTSVLNGVGVSVRAAKAVT
jgi:anaerobic selenocysteine-containing dehydrogenase